MAFQLRTIVIFFSVQLLKFHYARYFIFSHIKYFFNHMRASFKVLQVLETSINYYNI